MFKRLISCAAGLLIGIAPICVPVVNEITMSASAEDKKLDNGLEYTITDGEVKITGYDGSDVSLEIPSEIEGYPVTSIGDKAFLDCNRLIEITLPNSITEIGSSAFYDCNNLRRITLPNNLKSINNHVVYCCDNLRHLIIPESVKSISNDAFYFLVDRLYFKGDIPDDTYNPSNYKTVYYPADNPTWTESAIQKFGTLCTCIPYYTSENGLFYTINKGKAVIVGCDETSPSLEIPSTIGNYPVDSISANAFEGNVQLTNVIIPESVTSIGDNAFYACNRLIEITLPNSITEIAACAFSRCDNLTKVVIPNSVTSIGDYAFRETYLPYLIIPESVEYIGMYALDCRNKKNQVNRVYFKGDIPYMDYYSLNDTCATVYYPADNPTWTKSALRNFGTQCTCIPCYTSENGFFYTINNKGKAEIVGCDQSSPSLEIPSMIGNYPVDSISANAFEDNLHLTNVIIHESVTNIAENAFQRCTNLTEINFPNSVTSIGKRAFYGCTNLTEINFPDSLTSIESRAFEECTNLTEINFPDSLTSIESQAFFKCQSITEINFPDSITRIGSDLFAGYSYKNDNIEKIVFKGDAPINDTFCFAGVSTTVYYPGDNPTWTKSVLRNYYGDLTWIPYYEHFIIKKQPENASAPIGSEVKTEVTAEGNGLSYQWYYCEANSDKFIKSKVTGSTYKCLMTNESNGRKVYCEITDKDGDKLTSDTVTLTADINIIKQPENASAPFGSDVRTKVTATGQDLSYQWYYCEANSNKFIESKVTGSTYECPMTNYSSGRKVYCEITDKAGNMVVSDTVTLSADLYIIQQPENASAPFGSDVRTKVTAKGKDLSYQWYYCEANSDTFIKSKVTYSTYECPMTNESNGRKVYCEITDVNGNMVVSDTVTLSIS